MSARTWRLRWVCPLWLAMVSACGGGGGGDSDTAGVLQLVETSFDVTEGAVVNIRVSHDNDFFISQIINIKFGANASAQ